MSGDATLDDTTAVLHGSALDDDRPVRSLATSRAATSSDSPAPPKGLGLDADGPGGDIGREADAHEAGQAIEGAREDSSRSDATTTDEGLNGEERFETVSLGDKQPVEHSLSVEENGDSHHRSSTPPSPASPAHTPPSTHSPSVVSTVPTTAIDPSSSSQNVSTTSETAETDGKSAGDATPAATPQKKPVSTRKQTVMQKVVSMTRQRTLPPKSKEEEEKHLEQLAEMLAASREAEKRRRSEAEARSALRSTALATVFPVWEKSILPNWRIVLHDDAHGRRLRALWWDGTMPVRWRGRLWAMCIGNGLAVGKNELSKASERVGALREAGEFAEVEREAKEDVERVLPALKLFQEGRVMHEDLMEVLLAWTVHEKVTPRYARGLAFTAALLILNMSPAEAFVCLVNLVQKSFLRSFYSSDPDEVEAYYRVFDTLLADYMPRVYANFSAQVVRPSLYLFPWLSTLYTAFLPLDLATRIFDVFLLEGDSFVFRVAIVLLQILEPRLFNPNLDELSAVFEGTDRGAVGVVKREKGLLTANGGSIEERDGGIRVEVEDVYSEMGATEDRVFELLRELDWKEETFARLVERELPEVGV
ncbi:TBC1 domain family member 14 [Rhodotorula toruloides]|uniref:TBC1 domain family member 14 n=1 Tax=Rhodotorula toruloides TaxID=5286 RepID=A0A511K8Q1_RHOTO|nr:TBC1 domain family member 14 [Rhodotorula toruloides]